MPFGAEVLPEGGVRFALWAPAASRVELCLDDGPPIPVERDTEGWIRVEVPHGRAGSRYRYRIDGERLVPDPATRFQPDDVHRPSEVITPEAFEWTDGGWRGRVGGAGFLRAPRRNLHARGDARRRDGAPRSPGRSRNHRRRAHAAR